MSSVSKALEMGADAVLVNTEAAWKSVERYFPPDQSQQNRYYAHRAKQELARFYLEQNRWTEAQPLLADLANLAAVVGNRQVTAPWMEWLFSRTFVYPLPPAGRG